MENREKKRIQQAYRHALSDLREDPDLVRRVQMLAACRPKARRVPQRLAVRILAAVSALLILCGAALAVARPAVLNWLLGGSPASTPLEESVQTVFASAEADGISISVTSLVSDGERMDFSFALENRDPSHPTMVALLQAQIDGQPVPLLSSASPDQPKMVPSPHLDILPVQRNPALGGGSCRIPAQRSDSPLCTLTFAVYRPQQRFAFLLAPDGILTHSSSYSGEQLAEVNDSLQALRSFQNAVLLSDEAEYTLGDTLVDEGGCLSDPHRAHLNETARISLTFSFDASQAWSYDFSKTPDHRLTDCMVHVRQLRLSPLETVLELHLIPDENTEAAARALAGRYGAYSLTDASGAPVSYSSMDFLASNTPDVTQTDGRWVCRYLSNMPGLLNFPKEIIISTDREELLRFTLYTTF